MTVNKPIIASTLFVITALSVFFFIWPEYREFGDVKTALAKKQAEYNGASAYYDVIANTLLQIDQRKEALGRIDSALPSEASVASLIYFFQKKGAETGLLIRSINFSNTAAVETASIRSIAAKQEIKNITFAISLVGNYPGLKNFLASLESSARVFEVETISLVPLQSSQNQAKGQEGLPTYDIKLQIKTHTY